MIQPITNQAHYLSIQIDYLIDDESELSAIPNDKYVKLTTEANKARYFYKSASGTILSLFSASDENPEVIITPDMAGEYYVDKAYPNALIPSLEPGTTKLNIDPSFPNGKFGKVTIINNSTAGARILDLPDDSYVINGGNGKIVLSMLANARAVVTFFKGLNDELEFNYSTSYTKKP